jgi:hypothetical protein
MRTAALVLGIVGGVFVIIGGMVAIMIGGVAMAFEADGGFVAISLFWIPAGASLIAGAVLALIASREKPTTEGASS